MDRDKRAEWFKLLNNLLGPDPEVDRRAVYDFLVAESEKADVWRPAAALLLGCYEEDVTQQQRHTIKSAVWLNLVGDDGEFREDEGAQGVTIRWLLQMMRGTRA